MSLFKSMVRGFGFTVGSTSAKRVMNSYSPIDSLWKICWGIIKLFIIIAFLSGVIQGLMK